MLLAEWLEAVGLDKHPFADIDEETQPTDMDWVIEHPVFLNKLVAPGFDMRHHLIEAGQGGGKTTLRRLLKRHYNQKNTVVVELINWDYIGKLHQIDGRPIINVVIDEIYRKSASQLNNPLMDIPDNSPTNRLINLRDKCAIENKKCCIIIDRVDELSNEELRYINIIEPIIANIGIHKIQNIAFKYILTSYITRNIKFREDIVQKVFYIWRDEDLKKLACFRLKSINKSLEGLMNFAENNLQDVDFIIARVTHPSTPREFLHNCSKLIEIVANSINKENDTSLMINIKHLDDFFSYIGVTEKSSGDLLENNKNQVKYDKNILTEEEMEYCKHLLELLHIHRRTIFHNQQKEAQYGINVPTEIMHSLKAAREEVKKIKGELHRLRISVDNLYGDIEIS